MYKKFLETILPTQGDYCILFLNEPDKMRQRFIEDASLEKLYYLIERLINEPKMEMSFAMSTFTGHSRKADDSLYIKSFFLDIDVGKEKNSYANKEDAHRSLSAFLQKTNLPEPTMVNSGNGIHAYWILNEQILTTDWLPYAQKFKKLCIEHGLIIDPAVPADRSHALRIPGSRNYGWGRKDTPLEVNLINGVLTYDLNKISSCLGQTFSLNNVNKGLDDEARALLYRNDEYDFSTIATKSLEGKGCNQIKWILENSVTCPEPMWYAGISVAARCVDGDTAIHLLSEDYDGYSPEKTERKAKQSLSEAKWAHGCEVFEGLNPGGCDGCLFKGKVKTGGPIGLGLRIKEPTDDQKEHEKYPEDYKKFPGDIFPFMRGASGGIYYQPPALIDKKTNTEIAQAPYQLYPYDVVPIKRLTSQYDGESLHLRVFLPKDGVKDHILPVKIIGSLEKFKEFLFSNSIILTDKKIILFKEYLMKWASYLIHRRKAEDMRVQMGWSTPNFTSFVAGSVEMTPSGVFDCPTSPSIKNIAPHIRAEGTFEAWQQAANRLVQPGFEYHCFSLLAGFGSVLIPMTNVGGVVISLSGEKGSGKTGALQAGLSVFGDPVKQKIVTEDGATANALYQRASILKNLLLGIDETSNFKPDFVSQAVFKLPMNEVSKIRLQTSYNNERKTFEGSALITLMTTNQSNVQKLFETGKANPEGELRRLMEFQISKPPTMSETTGKDLFEPFKRHFGHAGLLFVKVLYEVGIPEVREKVQEWRTRIIKDFVDDTTYSFWIGGLSAIFTAGEIAIKHNILHYDIEKIYQYILKQLWVKHNRAKRERKSYEEIIGEFINKNITSMIIINDGKVLLEPRSPELKIRCEVDTGITFISASALGDYLWGKNGLQVNKDQFEEDLIYRKILLGAPHKKRLGTGWKVSVANVRAYEFKLDVSDVIKEITDESGGTGVDLPVSVYGDG